MFISKKATKENIYLHCVKSVRIRSKSGPHFPAFGLNTERSGVSPRIQSECGKMQTRIIPNTDIFQAVLAAIRVILYLRLSNLWLQVNVSHLHDHKFKHLLQDLFQDKTINPLCTCNLEAKQLEAKSYSTAPTSLYFPTVNNFQIY